MFNFYNALHHGQHGALVGPFGHFYVRKDTGRQSLRGCGADAKGREVVRRQTFRERAENAGSAGRKKHHRIQRAFAQRGLGFVWQG